MHSSRLTRGKGSARSQSLRRVGAQVVSEDAPLWIGTINDDLPSYDRTVLTVTGQGSAGSFPIIVADRLWGVLYLTRKSDEGFDETTVTMAALVCELMASGISRVDYHRQLHALAYTDPLTEMANRRAVDEQLLDWAATPPARAAADRGAVRRQQAQGRQRRVRSPGR